MEFSKRITHVYLDITRETGQRPRMVEGDTANRFIVHLTENGNALDITGYHVRAVFRRSDGHVVYQSDDDGDAAYSTTITSAALGIVTINLKNSSFRDGKNEMEVQVYKEAASSGNNKPRVNLITSAKMEFFARNCLMNAEAVQSSVEFAALDKLIYALKDINIVLNVIGGFYRPSGSMDYDEELNEYTLTLNIPMNKELESVILSDGNLVFGLSGGSTLSVSLEDYATEAWVNENYYPKNHVAVIPQSALMTDVQLLLLRAGTAVQPEDLEGFLRVSDLDDITIDLTGYATENWVLGKGYYAVGVNGIPKADLAAGVQESLGKADTAIQPTDVFVGVGAARQGEVGLVPAPQTGDGSKFLCGDGSWKEVSGSGSVPVMIGATNGTPGVAGLVPAPGAGDQNTFLLGSGQWALPPTFVTGLVEDNGSLSLQDTDVNVSMLAGYFMNGIEVFIVHKIKRGSYSYTPLAYYRATSYDSENRILYFTGHKKTLVASVYASSAWSIVDANDSEPTEDSDNPITSGAVYDALAGKQDTLVAGHGISISEGVISATGGGGSIPVDIEVDLSEISVPSVNLFDKDSVLTNTIISGSTVTLGEIVKSTGYWTSAKIPVTPGENYVFYTYPSGGTVVQRAAWYQDDDTTISVIEKGDETHKYTDGYWYYHTAPEGAAYLRICGSNSILDVTACNQGTRPIYFDDYKLYPLNEFRLTDVEDALFGATRRLWESGGIDTNGLTVDNKRARFARAIPFPFTVTLAEGYAFTAAAYYDIESGELQSTTTWSSNHPTYFESDGSYAIKLAVRTVPTALKISDTSGIIASSTGLLEYVMRLAGSIPASATLTTLPSADDKNFVVAPMPYGLLWSDGYCWRKAEDNNLAIGASAYMTIKVSDGSRVSGHNEEKVYKINSVTKLLSAIVICETLDQAIDSGQETYTVNATDKRSETEWSEDTTSKEVCYGDVLTPLALLNCSLVYSDNPATDCLARYAGYELDSSAATDSAALAAFKTAMLAKATALGLTHTSFPSGTWSPHGQLRSSPEDICKLIRYIQTTNNDQMALIRSIWGKASYEVVATGLHPRTWTITSTTTDAARQLIPEFVGGKTGSDDYEAAYGIVWEGADDENYYISVLMRDSLGEAKFRSMRQIIDEVYSIHARSLTKANYLPESDIKVAVYGVTTFAEVKNALLAGDIVVTRYNNVLYIADPCGISDTDIVFYSTNAQKKLELTSSEGWETPGTNYELANTGDIPKMDGSATYSYANSQRAARADHVHPSDTTKADKVERIYIDADGAVTQELAPNTVYMFTGDLTSLTLTLGTPIDGIANIYQVFFKNGLTPVTLTLPASVDIGDFVPEAEKISELNIQLVEIGNIKNYCIARGDNR